MYNQRYEEIGKVVIQARIDIFYYVRAFVRQIEKFEGEKLKFNNEIEAIRVKHLMNNPKNTIFKSMIDLQSGRPYWYRQEVDYVHSNLGEGRGVLFYFICNRCDRRVKYLYLYNELEPPLCRKCCQLPYHQKIRRKVTSVFS